MTLGFAMPGFAESVGAGFVVALIVALVAFSARRIRDGRKRRRARAIRVLERDGATPAVGCDIVFPDLGVRSLHRTDKRGQAPIPSQARNTCRIRIERGGRVVVNDEQLDFSGAQLVEVVLS